MWSYDFIFDQTEDGRRLKWLPICDEFSRELVALEVERRMEAKDVIRILDEAVLSRGCVPEFIRSDTAPSSSPWPLQDWIARRGFKTLYIQPGAPWQNAYSESFKLPLPRRVPQPGTLRRTDRGQSARQATPALAQPRPSAFVTE